MEGSLSGINLALFSGLSSIVTLIIGYVLAYNSFIYKIKNKDILIAIYYITVCFMMLDPLYISILSDFVGGGDLNGITTGLSISGISFKIIFGGILILNIYLFIKKIVPRYNKSFNQEKDS